MAVRVWVPQSLRSSSSLWAALLTCTVHLESALHFGSIFHCCAVRKCRTENLRSQSVRTASERYCWGTRKSRPQVQRLVSSVCGRVETIDSADQLIARFTDLRREGIELPAIVAAGEATTACEMFDRIASEHGEIRTAMVYLVTTTLNESDRARLRSIERGDIPWSGFVTTAIP